MNAAASNLYAAFSHSRVILFGIRFKNECAPPPVPCG